MLSLHRHAQLCNHLLCATLTHLTSCALLLTVPTDFCVIVPGTLKVVFAMLPSSSGPCPSESSSRRTAAAWLPRPCHGSASWTCSSSAASSSSAWSSRCLCPSPPATAQHPTHHKIWKYYQSTSKVHAKILQNLIVQRIILAFCIHEISVLISSLLGGPLLSPKGSAKASAATRESDAQLKFQELLT